MALTTTTKLRQPSRVPSHLIALDFMIFQVLKAYTLAFGITLAGFPTGVNPIILPFLLQMSHATDYKFARRIRPATRT
jgi:hypothetical protein